jgi:hypothetical protein
MDTTFLDSLDSRGMNRIYLWMWAKLRSIMFYRYNCYEYYPSALMDLRSQKNKCFKLFIKNPDFYKINMFISGVDSRINMNN